MLLNIGLFILALLVICGIIRVIITPSESIWDFIVDILWLDILLEVLEAILTNYGD